MSEVSEFEIKNGEDTRLLISLINTLTAKVEAQGVQIISIRYAMEALLTNTPQQKKVSAKKTSLSGSKQQKKAGVKTTNVKKTKADGSTQKPTRDPNSYRNTYYYFLAMVCGNLKFENFEVTDNMVEEAKNSIEGIDDMPKNKVDKIIASTIWKSMSAKEKLTIKCEFNEKKRVQSEAEEKKEAFDENEALDEDEGVNQKIDE